MDDNFEEVELKISNHEKRQGVRQKIPFGILNLL